MVSTLPPFPFAPQKPLPFLQDYCRIEYAASQGGSQGACKKTGTSFRRGDLRVVLTAGDPQKKAYLSLEAAGAELAPVVVHVGRRAFPPTTLSGLADLAAEDRQAFYQAFAVSASEAGKFDRQHPPPQRPSFDRPTSTGKAAKAAAVGKADEVGGAEEADAAAPGGRPAKRARAAAAVMAGDSAGSGGRGAASEELPQEPQQVRQGRWLQVAACLRACTPPAASSLTRGHTSPLPFFNYPCRAALQPLSWSGWTRSGATGSAWRRWACLSWHMSWRQHLGRRLPPPSTRVRPRADCLPACLPACLRFTEAGAAGVPAALCDAR